MEPIKNASRDNVKEPATNSSAPHAQSSTNDHNSTTEKSPFFRLPRELRDAIYDWVALDVKALYYEFSLKAGEPVQKTPLTMSAMSRGCPELEGEYSAMPTGTFRTWHEKREDTVTANGLGRVCKQFTTEYAAAVERRIECLLSDGRREPRLADNSWTGNRWVRRDVSKQEHADGCVVHNVHALTVPVPMVYKPQSLEMLQAVAFFTFRFFDSEELGPRQHVVIPMPNDVHGEDYRKFRLPGPLLQQMNNGVSAADWSGSKKRLYERSLWFQYFKRSAVGG